MTFCIWLLSVSINVFKVHPHGGMYQHFIPFLIYFLIFKFFLISHQFYTRQPQSPNSAHHHPHPTAIFPPWCPYVCSLHLCLNFCPATRFIRTFFLGRMYFLKLNNNRQNELLIVYKWKLSYPKTGYPKKVSFLSYFSQGLLRISAEFHQITFSI